MNTYKKYCPNVFIAQCDQEYKTGDVIKLTTKYNKEHECIVHNLVGQKNGFFYYSITRADGFNAQERAKNKAEKIATWRESAIKKSNKAYEDSNKHRDFLSLGEPIKVGHHSERRHRKIIEQANNNMRKSVNFNEKAKSYDSRIKYWESKAKDINLSMPESLEFFEDQLQEAKEHHKFLKDNPDKRAHSYSLTYANKRVKDLESKVKTAHILWGVPQQDQKPTREEKTQVKKQSKQEKMNMLIKKYGGFFAFNVDQLRDGYEKCKASGHLQKGEKLMHIQHGLYIPSKYKDNFIKEL